MSSLFLITLLTGIAAAYIYENTSEEIERLLAIIITGICSILGLLVAPWPIQLSIVIYILFSTRNLALSE